MNASPESIVPGVIAALRTNDGLIVALTLCVGCAVVLAVVGVIVRGAGASLRPLVFIGGLIAPIAIVFVVAQLVRARAPSAPDGASFGLAIADGRFVDRARLFGADTPAELIREARSGLPGILDDAEHAEAGVTLAGDTALVAQFPSAERARNAAAAYHRAFQLRSVSGDEESGWRATRGLQGDCVEMLRTGRHLFVWSAATREACAAKRSASYLMANFPALKPAPSPPLLPRLQAIDDVMQPLAVKVIGMALMLAIYVVWFFKGAGWASSVRPLAGSPGISATDLVARLLALNDLDIPFRVERGTAPNELIADWRYVDAKWLDQARAHGLRRTFRIRLALDGDEHVVRATDYTASFDWSAGAGGAQIDWRAAMGIMLFQAEQGRVFGLQIDDRGRLRSDLSYAYKFDLRELKSPLINIVTRAGWAWRPTVWQGPAGLRWLTE